MNEDRLTFKVPQHIESLAHARDKEQKWKDIIILRNKEHDFFIPIYNDPQSRSLYRLKKRILGPYVPWQYFITLTFANKYEYKLAQEWTYMTIWKDDGVNPAYKIDHTHPIGSVLKFEKCMADIGKGISGEMLNLVFNSIRKKIKFSYVWKYEEGDLHHRPHFHLLIKADGQSPQAIYDLFTKYWKFGMSHLSTVTSHTQVINYVNKYFSKDNETLFFKRGKRRYSTSRDVKAPPIKEENVGLFEYICTTIKNTARRFYYSTRDKAVAYYKNKGKYGPLTILHMDLLTNIIDILQFTLNKIRFYDEMKSGIINKVIYPFSLEKHTIILNLDLFLDPGGSFHNKMLEKERYPLRYDKLNKIPFSQKLKQKHQCEL